MPSFFNFLCDFSFDFFLHVFQFSFLKLEVCLAFIIYFDAFPFYFVNLIKKSFIKLFYFNKIYLQILL